jgi:hypothetical protein
MAEPAENSYVVTITLRGVKKPDVLEFVDHLKPYAVMTGAQHTDILTAHLKDEQEFF